MSEDITIKVENLSKTFQIPHEKHVSLKSTALNLFSKKGYETFRALKNINFEVKKGEFFGIIGRNGSGKSTLLKILAGIYVPDKKSGEVVISGKLSPFLELGVGFNQELTGRENLFLGGAILGLSKDEVAEKYDQIVDFSELQEFMDMKLKNYSSGMQVRLAFSLAINARAEVLLMDEVLAVGDSNFQSKCLGEFNRYRSQGKTVILVSHDVSIIQKYCDRAILLKNGEISKIGKAEDVGNEYIYQNMDEEEERLTKEKGNIKKKKSDSETSQGAEKKAEIKKVEFLNKAGKLKNVFKTGEDVVIRIYFDLMKEEGDLNFGIGLYNEENIYVFGTGTIIDKLTKKDKRSILEKGYAQINLKNIQLKNGTYFVKVGIYGEFNSTVYDFLQKSSDFKVFGLQKTLGIVELQHKWETSGSTKLGIENE